ncbi:MAG: hypothetical protein ABSC50_10370 [Candidatus Bathyarchaeia archaeon]
MTGKAFAFFTSRTIIVHLLTYVIAGIVAYWFQWGGVYGGSAMQAYMKAPGEFAPWVIPSQVLRGFILAVALYPFLGRILEMKLWGWLSVSSLYLLIGTIAGSGGIIEHIVFTTTPVLFTLETLPEITAQGLMFGYLLVYWEQRSHRK